MGLTFIKASIINPANPRRKTRLKFLVDSEAIYSVVPKKRLKRIGIEPHGTRVFTLADGTHMTREIGDAIFAINGERAASPVIFGEDGTANWRITFKHDVEINDLYDVDYEDYH